MPLVENCAFTKHLNVVDACPVLTTSEKDLMNKIVGDRDFEIYGPLWKFYAKKCGISKSSVFRRLNSLQKKNLLSGWEINTENYYNLFVKKDYSVVELKEERNLFNYRDSSTRKKQDHNHFSGSCGTTENEPVSKHINPDPGPESGTETSPKNETVYNINLINNNITKENIPSDKNSMKNRREGSQNKFRKTKTEKIYSPQFEKFWLLLIATFQAFLAAFPQKVRVTDNYHAIKAAIYDKWSSETQFQSIYVWFGLFSYLVSSHTDTWNSGGFTFGFGYLRYATKHFNKAKNYLKGKYFKSFKEFFIKATPEINGTRKINREIVLLEPRDWSHVWTPPEKKRRKIMGDMKLQTVKTIIQSVCETLTVFEKLTGLTFNRRDETHLIIAAEIEQVKILTKKGKEDKKYLKESLILAEKLFCEIDTLKIQQGINFCHECVNYDACKINGVLSNDPDCTDYKSKNIKMQGSRKIIKPN